MPQNGSVFLPRASAPLCEGAAHSSQPIDVPVAPFLINLGTCGSGSSTHFRPTKASSSAPQHPLAVGPWHPLGWKQHGAALLGLLHTARPSQPGHGHLMSCTPSVSPRGDPQHPGGQRGVPPTPPQTAASRGSLAFPSILIFNFSRPTFPQPPSCPCLAYPAGGGATSPKPCSSPGASKASASASPWPHLTSPQPPQIPFCPPKPPSTSLRRKSAARGCSGRRCRREVAGGTQRCLVSPQRLSASSQTRGG